MKKLFTLVAIAGLAFSTLGCAGESKPPAATPPATTDNTPAPDAAAPAATDAPAEDKK